MSLQLQVPSALRQPRSASPFTPSFSLPSPHFLHRHAFRKASIGYHPRSGLLRDNGGCCSYASGMLILLTKFRILLMRILCRMMVLLLLLPLWTPLPLLLPQLQTLLPLLSPLQPPTQLLHPLLPRPLTPLQLRLLRQPLTPPQLQLLLQ